MEIPVFVIACLRTHAVTRPAFKFPSGNCWVGNFSSENPRDPLSRALFLSVFSFLLPHPNSPSLYPHSKSKDYYIRLFPLEGRKSILLWKCYFFPRFFSMQFSFEFCLHPVRINDSLIYPVVKTTKTGVPVTRVKNMKLFHKYLIEYIIIYTILCR